MGYITSEACMSCIAKASLKKIKTTEFTEGSYQELKCLNRYIYTYNNMSMYAMVAYTPIARQWQKNK
jgi:hypothetical protein